ncbi:hypothetical protein ACWATR_34830 [Nostoc sp. UIC 10890]
MSSSSALPTLDLQQIRVDIDCKFLLAQAVHAFNMQEILAPQQGVFDVTQGDSTSKGQSVWSRFFLGLGESL